MGSSQETLEFMMPSSEIKSDYVLRTPIMLRNL